MSYQTHKNGNTILWPDMSDLESLSITINQIQTALTTLQSKISAEADQQDNYYGRNIKTITTETGGTQLSPFLDGTKVRTMSNISTASTKIYLENIEGIFLNCYYFISNSATCEETVVKDIQTNFNNYESATTGPYSVTIGRKVDNEYTAGQTYLVRTNVPVRNNKQYNELDEMTNNVDTFFMESNFKDFSIPKQLGLYNTPKATATTSTISSYYLQCYQDMRIITTNRFMDICHILDPLDSTVVKFSGTMTIDQFDFNHYVKTYACTYNGKNYAAKSSSSLPTISRNSTENTETNWDPYLILRQNITRRDLYGSAIKYYFPQYRTVAVPKSDPTGEFTELDDSGKRQWKETVGSLADLEMVSSANLKVMVHVELPDVQYRRIVKAGTDEKPTSTDDKESVVIPYSLYKNITVTLSDEYTATDKIACNTSKTIYVTQQLYEKASFCYNNDPEDVVTRTVNQIYEVTDNYKTISNVYHLAFETLQEAVGQKAYRIYCNFNYDQDNFIAHGDYKEYKEDIPLSQVIVGAHVRVIPMSTMLYGDQSCGTIYTEPVTLSSEAIKKLSLYCQLYRNGLNNILKETEQDGNTVTNYFFKAYASFDKRIKSRKNITVYVKSPRLYCDANHYHGQRARAALKTETKTCDSTNEQCFYYDAKSWRPFIYRKQKSHPEKLALYPADHDYECYLKRVNVTLQNAVGDVTTKYCIITLTSKQMIISCVAGKATIVREADLPSGVTRVVTSDTYAIYTIDSQSDDTFIQTYEQADNYSDHRYYYNISFDMTGIKIDSTSVSWAKAQCKHVLSEVTALYNRVAISLYIRYTMPLYLFGRLSDAGNTQVTVDSEPASVMPLTNVICSSIIVRLEQGGKPYEYTSVQYVPEAECTALFEFNSGFDTLTFAITENDKRNNVVNSITGKLQKETSTDTVKSTASSIIINTTTANGTDTVSLTPAGTFKVTTKVTAQNTELQSATIGLNKVDNIKFDFDFSKSTSTCKIQKDTDTETLYKEFSITNSTNKLVTTYYTTYKDRIPRIVGYNSDGLEVSNWYFYNGYNFDNQNIKEATQRLNGIIFANSIPQDQNVNVIVTYDFYEDECQQEEWVEMATENSLMYLDSAFSKTTSSVIVDQDNLQSAKCKVELTSSDNIQYIMYTCKDLSLHNIYVENDNLENVNALKITGASSSPCAYLANSTQRLDGFSYIESPYAATEISFLAKVASIYALSKVLNVITDKWEIPPRSLRVLKSSVSEAKLIKGYYIAIEDFIEPIISNNTITGEINHLTATGSDKIAPTVSYVYSWSPYYSATHETKSLPVMTIDKLKDSSISKESGGYAWDPSKMLLSVYPPKNSLAPAKYYRHLIPYTKAQDFLTAMQNPKYYCFVPTESATESVWTATKIVQEATDETDAVKELVLDFVPIISANQKAATSDYPTYLKAGYQKQCDYKTIVACFTWQDLPNVSGINMAWTTKALKVEETEEE